MPYLHTWEYSIYIDIHFIAFCTFTTNSNADSGLNFFSQYHSFSVLLFFNLNHDKLMILIIVPRFLKIIAGKRVHAMALFPFILVRDIEIKLDISIINHEKIHLKQQLELLVLPFYILYAAFYLFFRLKGQNHFNAYMSIPFEKEAYTHESDLDYLKNRPLMAWRNY